MASFRFLHTADIHLDSPLKGLAGQVGNAAERIRKATREAFEQLVSIAIDEKVDFLIIAGDLYDGDWRDYNTGLFFVGQMGRLNEVNIPVYLLHGNHDAESQITRRLDLPVNVHVFSASSPQSFRHTGLRVEIHGQSFRQRDVTENLVTNYPTPSAHTFNIGVLHTGLGGMGGHANYAPCSLNELVNKGYNYWALGHVHQANILHSRPHIVFPGNLQGRHIRETGAKGASLVTVVDHEIVDLENIACDVVRWAVLEAPLNNATNISDVVDVVREAIETAVADLADGRLLACRVVLSGRTDLHSVLLASEDQVLAEARASALGLGDETAWVEKIVIETEPTLDLATLAQREDAVGALQQILRAAELDDELLAEIEQDIGQLAKRLPHDLRAGVDDHILTTAIEGDYVSLVNEVTPYMLARLTAKEK